MWRRLLWTVVLLGIFIGAPVGWGAWELTRPIRHPEVVVTIAPGSSVAAIARELAAAGAIGSPAAFQFLVRAVGRARYLKAGEYVIPDGASMLAVYRKLRRGEFRTFRIRLPEGWSMRQIAAYLEQQPFARPGFGAEFLAACRDPAFLARLGLEGAASLEGYLYPSTYDLHRPGSAEDVAARLVAELLRQITPAMRERAAAMGLSLHHLLTLASIIEKETGAAAERPLVSSVFHNRLKQGMALASDPTVIYGLPQFDGNLRKADLRDPHPYNTYVHAGLPPGPIANPGLAAIEAALRPAATEYLFFVSRGNGTHAFASTYEEHLRNVATYQRHDPNQAER
ncbi:MAG: endolytic transglycosylase MltG [Deltaproteobacteria bacterium]|nr:endolytic transglycosylase MltG [Deltaproteobacteria bacterium]